jgi:uncharacterized membrane protein
MDQKMFTQRAYKTVTRPPVMQTLWARNTPAAKAQAVLVYTVWAAWCVMWAVIWAAGGPVGLVFSAVSLLALIAPFRPTKTRIRGYVTEQVTPQP